MLDLRRIPHQLILTEPHTIQSILVLKAFLTLINENVVQESSLQIKMQAASEANNHKHRPR